jgi:hypothetical protein
VSGASDRVSGSLFSGHEGCGHCGRQGSGKVAVCTNCLNMPVAGIWLRPPREKRAALGHRSVSGAGEEVFGDGSDWLALDLGL